MRFQKLTLSIVMGMLVFSAGCTSLNGESPMILGGNSQKTAPPQSASANDDLANALARVELAQAEAQAARAEADAAKSALESATMQTMQSPSGAAGSELFPPNPLPGHCYARVLIPATFIEQSEQVMVKAESTRIEIIQPEYDWVNEQKLVREATTRIEVIPAEYKTVTEQVLVKPETIELVNVPAQFEQISEQVIDKPARTEWKRGSHYISNALETRTDAGTGEVMCLVDVPATYKTVTRTVETVAPSVKEIISPAEYKAVTKTVVSSPATTREISVPAQFSTVRKLVLVKEGETREVKVPAEFETVTKRVQASNEVLEWREVLCDVNMTRELITELQQRLHTEGYFDSPVDGIYQQLTQNGVNRYAKKNGLPFGSNYIALEVANALNLSY